MSGFHKKIVISGHPVSWARGRIDTRAAGAVARVFTDPKRQSWKDVARMLAIQEMAGMKPLSGCIALMVCAYFVPPKSWAKWKKAAALEDKIRPTMKPDFDNLAKIAADALNGIVYLDDVQVVDGRALKFYSDDPRVEIWVRELDALPSQITRRSELEG